MTEKELLTMKVPGCNQLCKTRYFLKSQNQANYRWKQYPNIYQTQNHLPTTVLLNKFDQPFGSAIDTSEDHIV